MVWLLAEGEETATFRDWKAQDGLHWFNTGAGRSLPVGEARIA